MNTFVGNKELYEYLKNNIFFNQAKQEDKIFEKVINSRVKETISRLYKYGNSKKNTLYRKHS